MNEVQISSLKNILKKYRVKTASNVVTSNMDLNYEKFLEASEVIYVVDRIQSCYTNEKDIARLMDVKKEWISIIIEKGWCSPLIPFIDQYGASLTKRAIIYLIENNLWDSYDGKTALRNKQPDHYKGLLAIHEAAIYLQSEAPEEILAMPDIEDGSKAIDWEQRRYEIAKHILSKTFILGSPKGSAENSVKFADALIEELKGGRKNREMNE